MEKPDYDSQLNPEVAVTVIGIRDLRKIKLYPLSIGDQLELDDILRGALEEVTKIDGSDQSVASFISSMMGIVRDNLPTLLAMVVDHEENAEQLMREITNNQAIEIAEIIYRQNYERLLKKGRSLLPQGMETMTKSALEKPSPRAAKSTGTGSKTSTVKRTKKEA